MRDPARVAGPVFAGRRVLLGVSGGIAAYKSIQIARDLAIAGAAVDVVLTPAALDFVRPLSFEALTGRKAYSAAYLPGDPLLHIRLARECETIVIAPATANLIARAAAGMADDLLTAVLLATRAPVIVCPAMNDAMYAHPQTRANVERLGHIGYTIAGPAEGRLAWGEGAGVGRMIEPAAVLDHIGRALTRPTRLAGKRVLVTAGPTREAIDPVRFVGNRSSGRMGFAIAAAAWRMGADVVLVSGPSHLTTPTGVRRINVESAEEMRAAVAGQIEDAEVLVMAAAVADFRPRSAAGEKIKKSSESTPALALEPTADILTSTLPQRRAGAVIVGFALETETPVENGQRKLEGKRLDLLVVNDAREPGAGFEVETNRVTLLARDTPPEDLPLLSKDEVAGRILSRVTALLPGDAE
ncbi:MAG: bifunctional phosphopantothenoylcysteine decarboxylase/phosphopantothenate--cysteine ligase CoaBC [Gemmatimonadota bacterium]